MNTTLGSTFEHPPVFEDLGKMAAKLVYYNYEWRYLTLVMIQAAHMLIPLETFLLEYKQSVVIKMGKFIAYNRPVRQFVIFGEDSKEIVGVILWLSDRNYDNSGKYVIVCSATDYEDCDEKEVFEVLSANNIVNVLFLRADTDNSSLTFSYEKIIPGECKNKVPDVIEDVHVGCSNDNCFKSKFLPQYKNFYKCPLVVSTFEQPPFMHIDEDKKHISGEDGSLVNLMTSFLNASLVVKIPEFGNWGRYENNNWTGLPILQFPSNRHFLGIVCTWIWFCFIMRSCYQAALMNSLKRHDHEDYLPNFDKVLHNKYPFGGHGSLREYYADDDYIYNNWVNLELKEVYEKLVEISHGASDFVVADNKEFVKDYIFKSNGSQNLQIIPEKIVNSPTVMYLKRHSPLAARVNEILSRSVEAGLTQVVQKRYAVYMNYFFKHLDEQKTLPITLEHITALVSHSKIDGFSFSSLASTGQYMMMLPTVHGCSQHSLATCRLNRRHFFSTTVFLRSLGINLSETNIHN
ncbi:uncharacterized protein LOC121727102 [Aricia agestis]|uniref:uncharacterized protein LOC121727102 n=1 Tax=Aricia agestis TaxID=91739 RepID=UPI001C202D58|nr:uncharacterized protein LOC121727102 [Aricia agestis]